MATRPVPIAQIGSYAITTSARRSVGHAREVLLDLLAQLAVGLVVVALLLGLADAQDRRQSRFQRGRHLQRQRPVGLPEILAPLGVAEHDPVHAELAEHRSGDLACEGTLGLVVHVLRVDLDARAPGAVDHRVEER